MDNTFMKKKIIGLLAGFLFAFLLYAPVSFAAGGTIYVSLERFTLGQGYLVEPETMTFKDGETYEDIIKRLAKKHSLVLKDKYTEHCYYLVGIKNADTGKLNIPKAVTEMAPSGEGASAVYPPTNDQNDGNDGIEHLQYLLRTELRVQGRGSGQGGAVLHPGSRSGPCAAVLYP